MVYTEFISNIDSFNVDNIVFSKVKDGKQGFKRILIYVVEGSDKSPLYLQMGPRFCFGVTATTDMANKEVITGYQLAIPMWDQEGKTPEQEQFYNVFQAIGKKCVSHLVSTNVKKELKKPTLTAETVGEKLLPTWQKRDEHLNVDERFAPTLYVKLLSERDPDGFILINTEFADSSGKRIDPLTLPSNFKMQKCLLQFHSIYIGSSIKLQIKVIEVEIEQRKKRNVPLMLKPRLVEEKDQDEPLEDEDEQEQKEEPEPESEVDYNGRPSFMSPAPPTAPQFQDYIQPVSEPVTPVPTPIPEVKRRGKARKL